LIGGTAVQEVAKKFTQGIEGGYEGTVENGFKQTVFGNYQAASSGNAVLSGKKTFLGGSSLTCPQAARVGSEVNGFLKVVEKGSSESVFVC
jgi:hypothetical protein